ncbi:MAG: DNA-binding transcriptional regulator NagC [Aeromonas sp.]
MTGGQIANVDLIKQVNFAAVYRLIDLQGPISRVKIAELSQLAPASVTKITRLLIEHGLIKETSQQASTGGRRAISLTTITHRFQFVSAKLGRGYLQLSLYDLDGKELDQRITEVSEVDQQPVIDMLLHEIGTFIDANSDHNRHLIAIALTMPGLVNPQTGMVIYTPTYQIRDLGLVALLEEHFNLPCYIGNDIRSLALAEHFFGESRDCMDSILVSVHQGTGSGIITKGLVFLGQNRNVGEIGHIQVDPLGKRCHCGNFGCLETIASNEAIVDKVKDLISRGHPSRLQEKHITIVEVCKAALAGDELCRSVIEHVGEHLGRAVAITVNLFNPQKVLIAGEITAADTILFPAIRRCVEHQSLPSFHQGLPIVKARFQNQPTYGGFALVKRALLEGDLLQILMEKK